MFKIQDTLLILFFPTVQINLRAFPTLWMSSTVRYTFFVELLGKYIEN